MSGKFLGVPFWKIRRELARAKTGAVGLAWPAIGKWTRWRYDAARAHQVQVWPGNVPLQDEVAVFLIYQDTGVSDSVLFTLSWLNDQGVAPVVVSNARLSDSDKTRLLDLSYLVIQRPNLGYDFGGYREGILTVLERGIRPKALYVFNDSIWFPLRRDCDTLDRCRQAQEDIYGLHLSYLSRSNKWNEHVQSYFFRFSQALVQDPCFEAYWRKLPLMAHKRAVVRFCERSISWHFADRGFTFGGLMHWKRAVDWFLNAQDEAQLMRVFRYYVEIGPKEADVLSPMIAEGLTALDIRDRLAGQISSRKLFSTFVALHPEILMALNVPFLKRAKTLDMRVQRREIATLGLADQFDPMIRAEVLSRDL